MKIETQESSPADRGGSREKWERWWRRFAVGGVDHDAVLRQIAEEAGWSGRYAFLIVISAAISLLGLLMPSVAVLIGAMLLSPLMMPIIGLGFAIATLDFHEMRRSATALVVGALVAISLSIVLVTISPLQTITSEIAGRTQPTLFDLLVALLSAVAGGYALVRGRGSTVVGVAIAIALMPPLVVVGFGVATWNWTIFSGSLLLFLTNAITIALTAALVARVYGFGSHLSPHHTGWQLLLFLAGLGVLAVPLGASLKRIAFDAVIHQRTRDTLRSRFPEGARLGQMDIDQSRDPLRIRAVMLTPRIVANADRLIASDLHTRLGRAIDLHVDQVRISPDTGAAEAAQIARASDSSAASGATARERAVAIVALIAGADPSAVSVDEGAHVISAPAAALPGLSLAGYRALEARADDALDGWTARLRPPADSAPAAIPIREGVVDTVALDVAAWSSERLDRALLVRGGTQAQREAIADGIVSRGGQARTDEAGGALRLAWPAQAPDMDRPSDRQPR